MKQILQNLGSGETILAEVPAPRLGNGAVLISTCCSLVSLGTEKMLIDFGKGSLLAKARSQPDKVKQVLQKIKTDGLWPTLEAVRSKLDAPIPLGYCHVGHVLECGESSRYRVGDRVISNGPHAEQVCVPENLTAKIPATVSNEQAAFAVVGAIGLQGIRLIAPTLGERVVVSGLGLIGLLAVQILRANGCQVLGIDFDKTKLALAEQFGATIVDLSAGQDPVAVANKWTDGVGVDAVLVTASTKSDELLHQAATMCRQRARIVLVGVVGLHLQRADFYEKELSFQVSCSYGPGRYDPNYEKRGLDYPIGFVRWTEKRNFEAILQLMADGKVDVDPLITHRFAFDNALNAYKAISEPGAMGILLEYQKFEGQVAHDASKSTGLQNSAPSASRYLNVSASASIAGCNRDVGIAFIGAGDFTTRTLLPLLPKTGVKRLGIVSVSGVSAAHAAKKFGFTEALTNSDKILADANVDAVFITTPHNMHAQMVCDALSAGKHVFVEKPLALSRHDLERVEECLNAQPNQLLLVGFNRRFSPHMIAMKDWLRSAPANLSIVITVNAGAIPSGHWTQNKEVGGGRIAGEACHFIDLARFLVGHPIVNSTVTSVIGGDGRLDDCVTISLSFADGSVATVHYLANGSKDFPKERIEVFAGGKVTVCDNFRFSREFGGNRRLKTSKQNKGHAQELEAFLSVLRDGGKWPIPREELIEVSRVTLDIVGKHAVFTPNPQA